MWKILLEEFYGDLRAQKTRAFLTMFAITWGTIAVVLLLSFGEGLKRTAVNGLLGAGERIYMIWGGSTTKLFQGLPRGRRVHFVEQDLDLLKRSIPQIDLASISYGRYGTSLKTPRDKTTTYMEGVDPAFGEMRHMFPAPGSRFLDQRDVDERRRVLFLGNKIAERLFGTEDPVGKTVQIEHIAFRVIGILPAKGASGFGDQDDMIVVPIRTAMRRRRHFSL